MDIVIMGFLLIYLLPALVAFGRKRQNKSAILVFNLLLGWSLIGWVIALVWAMTETNNK